MLIFFIILFLHIYFNKKGKKLSKISIFILIASELAFFPHHYQSFTLKCINLLQEIISFFLIVISRISSKYCVCLLNYIIRLEEKDFYLFFCFSQIYSSNWQIHLKEKLEMGNNSAIWFLTEERLFRSLRKECYLSISKFYGLWLTGETIWKKTGIQKNLGHFFQNLFLWFFAFQLLIYVQNEFHSYLHLFLRNCSSKLQRNLKEI